MLKWLLVFTGSGARRTAKFLALPDRGPSMNMPKIKKNLDFLSFDFFAGNDLFSLKTDKHISTISSKQINLEKNTYFFGISKATEEKSRI